MILANLLENITISDSKADEKIDISDIRYDSRNVYPGCLFVAVRGYQSDGHRFIGAAVNNGAVCVICEEPPKISVPYILVSDSRKALAQISKNFFGDPAKNMKIIGVTGTNGKTTTTTLIKHMLESCDPAAKVGLVGTNQNMIQYEELENSSHTTPESYELYALFAKMRDSGCTHVVMEVSSHALELKRVYGVSFSVGAFTNITQDHLDFHKTMDEYSKAKAKLFLQCEKAAINIDDPYASKMTDFSGCEYFYYSTQKNDADLTAKDIRLNAQGIKFIAMAGDQLQRISLAIPGMFSVYNALTVISCGFLLGLDLKKIAEALETAPGVKGRMEVAYSDEDFTILIDYAHTPDALDNLLRAARSVSAGRLVVLFGCGGDRDKTKRPIMGSIAARLADFTIITSDNPRTEKPSDIIKDIFAGIPGQKVSVKVIEDRTAAINWAIDNRHKGDLIILAGKGHETYQIIGDKKRHMDEREIILSHLSETL